MPHTRAYADIRLAPPFARPWVLRLIRAVSGVYLRLGLGCRRVTVLNPDTLVESFRAALAGEQRLIIAFRHPYVDEPQILGWLFLRGVELQARLLGVRLPMRPHALFIHGYEVPRWSGPLVRWLLPRSGSLPVHHSRMDSRGMARIRKAIVDGIYPLALAPEGQVSYRSEAVPRIESGTVRLGFEAASALARAGRSEPVIVLPLSVHRRYDGCRRSISAVRRLLAHTEGFVGVAHVDRGSHGERRRGGNTSIDVERLDLLLDRILTLAERLYHLSPSAEPADNVGSGSANAGDRDTRLAVVVDQAVLAGERILGIGAGHSGIIERVYRIRQIGWDRIHVRTDPRKLPPLERAVADRQAGEAWYAMRHMELADFAWYFRTSPPGRDTSFDLLVEYVQNLWDFANRLAGGAISGRRTVRPFRALIVAGRPIDLSSRVDQYHSGKKTAVGRTMADLEASYRRCIVQARRHPDNGSCSGG